MKPRARINIAEIITISLASIGQFWRQSRSMPSRQAAQAARDKAPLRQASHTAAPHRITLPVPQVAVRVGALSLFQELLNSTTKANNAPIPHRPKARRRASPDEFAFGRPVRGKARDIPSRPATVERRQRT